jgi:hypothetical protein
MTKRPISGSVDASPSMVQIGAVNEFIGRVRPGQIPGISLTTLPLVGRR